MTWRCARFALLLCLWLAPVWAQGAEETLSAAYGAILRGDYDAGQAIVDGLVARGTDPSAQRVQEWLRSYRQVFAQRGELKTKTFEWNVEQAQKALADDKTLLALSFTAQAAPYAADPNELVGSAWVAELTQRAKQEARQRQQDDRWTGALNYYLLLERVYPNNEELRGLSEAAIRHARLENAYKDPNALHERIRDVDRRLLQNAVKMIEHLYYQEPDFKEMSYGGLDNLVTLCGVSKLQGFLDGLGNPALREHFLRRVSELRTETAGEKNFTYRDFLRLFNRLNDLNRESVELPEGLLVVEFLEGALSKLDDYSNMVWPADATDFEKMMMGNFEGVGIQLGLDERTNRLKVVTPIDKSPALEAGIQPDDLIVAVNGNSTAGWSTDDAVRNIMGPGGTEVVLTIQRPRTGETIPYKLIRRRIDIPTVRGVERLPSDLNAWNYMLDRDTGVAYIRLLNFHPDSAAELRSALQHAQAQGMKGLILDVRSNPGGLDVAVNIVSTFVSDGDVVSTRGRQETERRERVVGAPVCADVPLVVLVNEGSASASEILAGALQDHHRAVILGNRTFGKGSVQHVQPLADQGDGKPPARLKLTTALYYLPSGRTPHKSPKAEKWGVDPDRELKLTPKEFRRIIEHERESNIIHNEARDSENKALSAEEQASRLETLKSEDKERKEEPPPLSDTDIKQLEADPKEAPKTDPQLEAALLLIRVKLAAGMPWPAELAAAAREKPANP